MIKNNFQKNFYTNNLEKSGLGIINSKVYTTISKKDITKQLCNWGKMILLGSADQIVHFPWRKD